MNKILLSLMILLSACSGIKKTDTNFYVHAESFQILGFAIPGDDLQRAQALVPTNGDIEYINSTPDDWSSLIGVINKIISIQFTEISGELED